MRIRALVASVAAAAGIILTVTTLAQPRPATEVCAGALSEVACVPPSL